MENEKEQEQSSRNDLAGNYGDVKFRFNWQGEEQKTGILIVNLRNGVESTHIIENWGITRVFQYIESMKTLV
jgi:hypothetical protein